MWDQSPLTSSGQVEALRLLSEWWESSRPVPAPWGRRRARGATVADVLVPPPGHRPAHLEGTRVVAGSTPTAP